MLSCYVSLAVARAFRADLTNQRIMIILLCELGFLTGGEHGLDRNRATTRVERVPLQAMDHRATDRGLALLTGDLLWTPLRRRRPTG